jgi:hypothetical protein
MRAVPEPAVMLAAAAQVRVFAAEPALSATSASALCTALERLLAQFVREGRCASGQATAEAGGRFVVVTWEGSALSGCSHDKLAQVVTRYASEAASAILDAPPIAIGIPPRLTDRAGLRAELAAGTAERMIPVWPRWAATLGEWQAGPVPLAESPFARLVNG